MLPAIAAIAGTGLQAAGNIAQIGDQRKQRRWMIQQYLMEKEARARAAQRDQQQQEFQNQVTAGNYAQNQTNNAMDIFGAYNRNIGR